MLRHNKSTGCLSVFWQFCIWIKALTILRKFSVSPGSSLNKWEVYGKTKAIPTDIRGEWELCPQCLPCYHYFSKCIILSNYWSLVGQPNMRQFWCQSGCELSPQGWKMECWWCFCRAALAVWGRVIAGLSRSLDIWCLLSAFTLSTSIFSLKDREPFFRMTAWTLRSPKTVTQC